MEYTNIFQPLILIFVCFLIGAFFGALAMFRIMYNDNELLRIDMEVNQETLRKCEQQLDQYLNKYKDDDYEAY
tara:strand:+ start:162 stop:380 length:219 start_codon:yes stop_codon:yes gene_type:complete